MKVITRQRNSRMCIMCGLDNPMGVNAPFYSMADGSVITLFKYRFEHQSYPGRVHGGLITSMLDELGMRALWAKNLNESVFGVTVSLETNYRKPVPYQELLLARGEVVRETSRFFTVDAKLYAMTGELLAGGLVKYIKLDVDKIVSATSEHDEMPYLIQDNVKEIDFNA